jgi:uncharacterized protein YutE (UPF0331/DUF86 family)
MRIHSGFSEKEILTKELFGAMENISKFRNIIVHHYDRVAPEIVVGILRKDLEEVLGFKTLIINLLNQ